MYTNNLFQKIMEEKKIQRIESRNNFTQNRIDSEVLSFCFTNRLLTSYHDSKQVLLTSIIGSLNISGDQVDAFVMSCRQCKRRN